MTSCNYDRIADQYEELRGGQRRAEIIASALEPMIIGRRVLDVGVGTGIIAAALERRGFTVFGIDISRSMLAKAHPRVGGRIVCATGECIPLREGSCDTATFVWSLHHIDDQIDALREAGRVVGSAGRIVVVSARSLPQTDEIGQWFTRLTVLSPREHEPLAALYARADLQIVDEGAVVLEFEQSPDEQAQLIEDRRYSPLWDLDDARWREVVRPVIDGLRALPDSDRPRTRVLRQPYHVLTSA
jgi:ubiquinone/menaquinone biosynthesis C-methylase UbiE